MFNTRKASKNHHCKTFSDKKIRSSQIDLTTSKFWKFESSPKRHYVFEMWAWLHAPWDWGGRQTSHSGDTWSLHPLEARAVSDFMLTQSRKVSAVVRGTPQAGEGVDASLCARTLVNWWEYSLLQALVAEVLLCRPWGPPQQPAGLSAAGLSGLISSRVHYSSHWSR